MDGFVLPEHAGNQHRTVLERPAYAEMATKFLEHFLRIATAVMHAGADTGMWDEEDGFFYDVLRRPDGTASA